MLDERVWLSEEEFRRLSPDEKFKYLHKLVSTILPLYAQSPPKPEQPQPTPPAEH